MTSIFPFCFDKCSEIGWRLEKFSVYSRCGKSSQYIVALLVQYRHNTINICRNTSVLFANKHSIMSAGAHPHSRPGGAESG
jgi:hypothetical protein